MKGQVEQACFEKYAFGKSEWLVLELPAANQKVSNSVFSVSSYILVLRYCVISDRRTLVVTSAMATSGATRTNGSMSITTRTRKKRNRLKKLHRKWGLWWKQASLQVKDKYIST